MAKLNDRQVRFCEEYLIDLNATEAAIRAGYSKNTARQMGSENLSKPDIASFIAELKQKRSDETTIDAAWVLRQAVKVHDRCMQAEPIIDKEGGSTGEYKFEHTGANKALEIIGKHVGVQAFLERKEVAVVELTHEEWLDNLK